MTLSQTQIAEINYLIQKEKVTIPTLKDDILDHLCCVTEIKMEDGKSFDEALREAVLELSPDGLESIQHETVFLLNSNKDFYMKKITFFIGALCAFGMGLGCLLALIKFSMGHMIFGLSAFSFIIFFLPVDAIRYLRSTTDRAWEKVHYLMSTSSTIILATGVLSKVMLLPGADEMIVLGLIFFLGGYLPLQLFKMFRESFSR